jgi:hypothetical protein
MGAVINFPAGAAQVAPVIPDTPVVVPSPTIAALLAAARPVVAKYRLRDALNGLGKRQRTAMRDNVREALAGLLPTTPEAALTLFHTMWNARYHDDTDLDGCDAEYQVCLALSEAANRTKATTLGDVLAKLDYLTFDVEDRDSGDIADLVAGIKADVVRMVSP